MKLFCCSYWDFHNEILIHKISKALNENVHLDRRNRYCEFLIFLHLFYSQHQRDNI